tara:strand:- start:674 stop:1879 length:1206 start_codon:yes stop_codon:yes gene_type:complete
MSDIEDWENTNLGSIFNNRKDKGHIDEELLSVTGSGGVVRRSSLDRRDTSNKDKKKYLLVKKGDLAYNTMRMWQGVSGVSALRGIVSPAYTVCEPTERINSEFAGYLFKDPLMISLFKKYSQGLVSDTWNLKYEKFAQISCCLPPIEEQKKIAEILSQTRDLIYKLQRKRCKVKNLLKAKRENLFQNFYEKGDLVRVKVSDLLASKDLQLVQDGNHGEKHPTASQFIKNGIPFVMASHIKDGCFVPDKRKCLSNELTRGLRIGHSLPGDVLLTHKATIGETCIVPKNHKEIMLSPQVTLYRLNEHSFLTAELLKQFFSTLIFQKEILEMSGQSTRDYIGVKAQRNLHIFFPKSNSIARKITEPLLSISEQHLSITKQINLHNKLLSALSQDLLSGRKRVNF